MNKTLLIVRAYVNVILLKLCTGDGGAVLAIADVGVHLSDYYLIGNNTSRTGGGLSIGASGSGMARHTIDGCSVMVTL